MATKKSTKPMPKPELQKNFFPLATDMPSSVKMPRLYSDSVTQNKLESVTGIRWESQGLEDQFIAYIADRDQAFKLEGVLRDNGLSATESARRRCAPDQGRAYVSLDSSDATKLATDRGLQAMVQEGLKAKGFNVGAALY